MPGRVFQLTGPPGSGKTTTALTWSLRRAHPTWVLDWDVVAGVLRIAGSEGDPYASAAEVVATMAGQIVAEGVDCVVVGARLPAPPAPWAHVWDALDDLDPIVIALLPSVETCVARNDADPGRRGAFAVAESTVRSSAAAQAAWRDVPSAITLDTTSMTVDDVCDALETAVSPGP